MLTIRLLNGFQLEVGGRAVELSSQGSRAVLAYCATYIEQVHMRARVAGVFWPDWPDAVARRRLSHALWEIGQATEPILGSNPLLRTGTTIGLNPKLIAHVDVVEFERAWAQARAAASPVAARNHLQQALALYTGDFLAGFYDDWTLVEQERLRELYFLSLQKRVELEKLEGNFGEALAAALMLVEADPLRETAYQAAIRLYGVLGRAAEAHRLFARCRELFAQEMGVEPAPETVRLIEEMQGRGQTQVERVPALSGDDIPLVGRAQERQTLLSSLDEAGQGHGGVVWLTGEAGAGKSRLLRTLAEDADWRGMVVLWGHAQENAHGKPYFPLIAALDMGITPLRAQQLATLLDGIWLQVAAQYLPRVKDALAEVTVPPALGAEQEHIRVLEMFVRLVQALGEITPLLLILEDIHWADEATLDALAYLAQRLQRSHVLLVASFRPEDARLRSDTWSAVQAIDRVGVRRRIRLELLDPEACAELVRVGLDLGESPRIFAARLHAETSGNPLFILESLRTLYAEGLLVRNAYGQWSTPFDKAGSDYAELPVAPAVERTIARRLTRLANAERSVLDWAAVLGAEVSLGHLAQLDGLGGRALLAALATLVSMNFLRETSTSYRFSHDKVREAVYLNLPPARCRTLHRTAAGLLAGDPDGASALIAHHYEAGEEWAQAAHFHYCAGREAAQMHIYRTALHHLDRAEQFEIQARETIVNRYDFLVLRESVLDHLGDRARQRIDLDALLHWVQTGTASSDSERVMVALRYGRMLTSMGHYDAALEHAQLALRTARRLDDLRAVAEADVLWGQVDTATGKLTAAVKRLQRAADLADKIGAVDVQADALGALSTACETLSLHEQTIAAIEQARECYRALKNPVGEADLLITLGNVFVEQGNYGSADGYFEQALDVVRASGFRAGEARALSNWGNVGFLGGNLGPALARYRAAATIFDQIQAVRHYHLTMLNVGALLSTFVGYDSQSERTVVAALDYFEEHEHRGGIAQAAGVLSQFAYLRRDFDHAVRLCTRSIGADEDDEPWLAAQGHHFLAVLKLAQEQPVTALAHADRGLDICRDRGFAELLPVILATQAEVLLALDRVEEAQAAIQACLDYADHTAYQIYGVHFAHFLVLEANAQVDDARLAATKAYEHLAAVLHTLAPEDAGRAWDGIPLHHAIRTAWAKYQDIRQRIRLPRADAPLGRPLMPDEETEITWTPETAEDRTVRNRGLRRRNQLLRLLHEAQQQGACPAYHHLADALEVSERTILRDIALIKQAGVDLPPTRGN